MFAHIIAHWITLIQSLKLTLQRRQTINELRALPDYLLNDIGLERDSIAEFARALPGRQASPAKPQQTSSGQAVAMAKPVANHL